MSVVNNAIRLTCLQDFVPEFLENLTDDELKKEAKNEAKNDALSSIIKVPAIKTPVTFSFVAVIQLPVDYFKVTNCFGWKQGFNQKDVQAC